MIPVIDLSDYRAGVHGAREAAAGELRTALCDVGFFSIVGHGLAWNQITEIYDWAARYHALADEAKLRPGTLSAATMGYSPMQGEQISGRKPSLNAAFFMARPGSARNRWPELDGFEAACSAYYRLLEGFCRDWLLPLYAVAVELNPHWFQQFFKPALATLRLTHYPPAPVAADQWGIDPHADAGFMTMLPANRVGGLHIKLASGDWFEAGQEPESFIVNAGDTLHRWTNGRFRSTVHRVVNTSGIDRYAIPFFYDPRVDTVIEPLPSCCSASNPAQWATTTYRELLTTFMGRAYQTVRDVVAISD